MKKSITTTLLLALAMTTYAQDNSTIVEGIYSGKNVYIKNPKSNEVGDFCVYQVIVNGKEVVEEMQSTAFSIDLENMDFEITDPITIELKHNTDCSPYVINPGALSTISSCVIEDILLNKGGTLQWTTVNESGHKPFTIEQYKWNRWVKIGEVNGKGQKEINKYSFLFDMHYGTNTIRIKQMDGNVVNTSRKVSAESIRETTIEIKNTTVKNTLEFSEETSFEIWNEYGILIISEYGIKIDLTDLKEGIYYVNYGSTAGTMITKK